MGEKTTSPTSRITITLEELVRLKADARGFSFLPRQPVNSLLSGRHASRLRGRGLTFEELRRYHQGDDIRTIDWKATARLRTPHVRVYSEERERPILLVVDQRSSMYFGSRRAMKSVTAVELAALAAWRTLDVGDRVGAVIFDDHKAVELSPQRSQSRVMGLLHKLAQFNQALSAESSETAEATFSLNDALTAALRVAKHDHLVVVVSDLDGVDAETKRLITRLQSHNDVIVAAVYDPMGATLQTNPGMFVHAEGERFAVPHSKDFSKAFTNVFTNLVQNWREIFRSLRIPLVPISTSAPVVDQIRELLGTQTGK